MIIKLCLWDRDVINFQKGEAVYLQSRHSQLNTVEINSALSDIVITHDQHGNPMVATKPTTPNNTGPR